MLKSFKVHTTKEGEKLQIASSIMVILGGLIMGYSTFMYYKLLRINTEGMSLFLRICRWVAFAFMLFFVAGYIIGAIDIIKGSEPILYFIGIVFFVASLFVFLMLQYLMQLTKAIQKKKTEAEEYNKTLEQEVESRMIDVIYRDNLLYAVSKVASLLLASDTDTFDNDIIESMGMLGKAVGVDRVYVWKNSVRGDKLYCTQLFEWSEGAEAQQGNEFTIDIPYDESAPGWEDILSSNRSVKGLVKNLSVAEQEQLSPQGIISILVVPVFLGGGFWGFVGFDDCQKEREFFEQEEGILRSASTLIATAMLRNEMTQNLVAAREQALESARAKSVFLSNMSHEIRTPINAITGMTAIAKKSKDMDRVNDSLNKIEAATRQLLAIINDILDMSKIDAGKIILNEELFDLHSMLNNIESIVGVNATQKKQKLSLDIAKDVPKVIVADEVRLTQILLNLLSNAIKFTDEGGDVKISAKKESGDKRGSVLTFSVTDNGIGIADEQKSRLFRAFEQAEKTTVKRYSGTGLGLAISKSIAEIMGGDIEVESELGKGSCFTARVYVKNGDSADLKTEDVIENLDFTKFKDKKILLVEDIEINQEIVKALLADYDMNIECASNGLDAVEKFKAAPNRYDLIFMDVHMPVMDGYTATRTIRSLEIERAKTVPIIAMTANAFAEDIEKCLDSGMDNHIAKPIDADILYKLLGVYL